jgi:hypothetical protein
VRFVSGIALGRRSVDVLTMTSTAKFIDKAMRKGQKGRSDQEFEDKLNAVLALYQFTKGA